MSAHDTVLLVCDANQNLGTGHVMRQITLGTALREIGFTVQLFCHSIPTQLIERAKAFGVTVIPRLLEQWEDAVALEILKQNPTFVVFDGYQFSHEALKTIWNSSVPSLVVDDNGEFRNQPCNAFLNQNLHADSSWYLQNPYKPNLMLGLDWALIRKEIVDETENSRSRDDRSIFISIGGADPLGITGPLAAAFDNIGAELTIASGFYKHNSLLSPKEFAVRMSRSTIGVIACGTTTWEACLLQLPFVGLVTVDNQELVGKSLETSGICDVIDCRTRVDIDKIVQRARDLLDSAETQQIIADRCAKLVDGLGAQRVAKEIERAVHGIR